MNTSCEYLLFSKLSAIFFKKLRLLSVLWTAIVIVFTSGAVYAAPEAVSSDATPQEIKLGDKVSEEIEKRFTVIVNPVYKARVETIVNRLLPYMERNLIYDVKIVDVKAVNAFALAGGKIYVTTAMLDFVKTDIELAGVIAHEMVHADRKHVITQTARNNRMTLLAIAAAIASKGEGAAIIAANALQVAVMGAYSIDIECEADAYGIDALTRAGYNPVGMLTLQERLKEESMKHAYVDPGIYQTHPEIDERIDAAHTYMEKHDIPVNRKYALGNLRTGVEVRSGDLALVIDDEPVWLGMDDEQTRSLFSRVSSDLWDFLQLETVPYDVRVDGDGPDETFLIKSRQIARSIELPYGTEPLTKLREGVHGALSRARNSHPMADYYK